MHQHYHSDDALLPAGGGLLSEVREEYGTGYGDLTDAAVFHDVSGALDCVFVCVLAVGHATGHTGWLRVYGDGGTCCRLSSEVVRAWWGCVLRSPAMVYGGCGSVQVLQAAEQFGGIVAGDQGLQRGRQL